MRQKKNICGVGINDFDGAVFYKGIKIPSYRSWDAMIRRCYYHKSNRKRAYEGCFVCEDWLKFSNFKKWFDENYNPNTMQGWHLDKDILAKGNKVYSPDTCCFVPQEINVLFTSSRVKRGECPIGVSKIGNRYRCNVHQNNNQVYLGCFKTIDEAFMTYKSSKEKTIRGVADEWKGKIADNVYQALYNYKIEITD